MLENFFFYGVISANAESGTYSPLLVLISYVVAACGSYIGLAFAPRMFEAKSRKSRNLMHLSGAFALGSGIWSMHFIGMLAYKMDMAVSYDPLLTILSMLIAVGIAYGVLQITNTAVLGRKKFVISAALLGFAICAMHYTGMSAMNMDADLRYTPGLFMLSVLIAITASGAALWIVFFLGRRRTRFSYIWRIAAALVMGAAICGMHYTGMAAAVFMPFANMRYDPYQSFGVLGFAIAIITSIIFGIALAVAIYHEEQETQARGSALSFPKRLLTLVVGLTIVIITWAGGNSFYIHQLMMNRIHEELEIGALSNEIMYLSNIHTQAARMAAYTGDLEWENQYKSHITVLENDMKEALAIFNDRDLKEMAGKTDIAFKRLLDVEGQTLALVHQGKLTEAKDLMDDKVYTLNRMVYSDDVRNFLEKIRQASSKRLLGLTTNLDYTVYLILFVIVVLMVSWYFALRSIRRWHNDKKRMEQELQTYIETVKSSQVEALIARGEAEKANLAKSDFLANMSHEIRTPMNSMLGMTNLLLDTRLNAEQRGWADIIRKSGESLLQIINDILDLSKIEAGKLPLEKVSFSVHDILVEITDVLMLKTQEKGIRLLVNYVSGPPPLVIGDPVRLKQVLFNLASNAVKFTASGHVLIKVEFEHADNEEVRLHIAVEDTGVGIPENKIGYVFEKFSQAEESTTRKFGGTGLGLTICSRLVKMMNGKLWVESAPAKGSAFLFDICLPYGKQEEPVKLPPVSLKDIRILVVDDYAPSLTVMQSYMSQMQLRCDVAPTIIKARQMIKLAHDKKDPYQFVTLAYKVGSENSLEFSKEITESSSPRDAPFVILTSSKPVTSTETFADYGISGFFFKPVYPQYLEATFRFLLQTRQKNRHLPLITRYTLTGLLDTGAKKKKGKKISFKDCRVLVVEDMDVNLTLMLKVLEKLGCNADGVTTGVDAINMMRRADYALVFMDCQMPDMDGYEATNKIRKEEESKSKHTPIIALTADAMIGDRERCINAGMDDYLNKPFKPVQIEDMLHKWVH